MQKKGEFAVIFILAVALFFTSFVFAKGPDLAPEYIPCLDEPYGFRPNGISYPEYYQRSYVGHNAAVLHRKHVYCDSNESYELAMKGLEEQYLVLHGEKRDYCNYICRDRYYEQCILDGSFDTYYMEWCEDSNGVPIVLGGSTYWDPAGYDCYSDRDCSIGNVCNAGYCSGGSVGDIGCTSSFDCNSGEVCTNAKCVGSKEASCVVNEDCDTANGSYCINQKCIGIECGYDAQCNTGEICREGKCITGTPIKTIPKVIPKTILKTEVTKIEVIEKSTKETTPTITATESKTFVSNCGDSDGGLDYYFQGEIKAKLQTFSDHCLSEDVLLEYFCDFDEGREVVKTKHQSCLDSCVDGACIKGKNECPGCFFEEGCYSFGFRKNGAYCDREELSFANQLESENICENNFECGSNLCVSGTCVDEGVFKKFLNWFKGIF